MDCDTDRVGDVTEKLSKIEFDVNLTCESCVHAVEKALEKVNGIESFNIHFSSQSVVITTKLPSQVVLEILENTGRKAVLKGIGSDNRGSASSDAAVAEINSTCGVIGVVRFHQMNNDTCIIDGTIDGLKMGEHGLHIHEFGDLSNGCSSIGNHFNPSNSNHGGPTDQDRHYGDLGNISADESGRASFRREDPVVKVWDIIGRSLAVTSDRDDLGCETHGTSKQDGNSGNLLGCAIIARSAGLFQNPKRLCQCDGVSIWDEKPSNKQKEVDAKL